MYSELDAFRYRKYKCKLMLVRSGNVTISRYSIQKKLAIVRQWMYGELNY